MHPLIFGTIRAYPLFLALAAVVGCFAALRQSRSLNVSVWRKLALAGGLAVAGISGAKVYAIAEHGAVYDFSWEAANGFRYPGAILALLAALPLLTRRITPALRPLQVADIAAVAVPFAMATSRIGCLLEGCCNGAVSTLPWAVSFVRGTDAFSAQVLARLLPEQALRSLPVQPLQIYFAILALSIGLLLVRIYPRRAYDGQVILVYLAVHETGKFLLEHLRYPPAPHLQLLSLLMALGAGTLLVFRHLREAGATSP